ncbi:2-oxoacid:acceptor oxidoreductase family protein [Proteiniclasticum sp. C24MP]|uniref:2-oxoacid:acceptor oxidoreductase family protein n=1 Tax=Proteiniclasticum sp. C24MP TaxID=3374101 RepID=UPI003754F763
MKEKGYDVKAVDAQSKAIELGNAKVANMILLGILAKDLGMEKDLLDKLIGQYFKPALQDVNLKAMELGYSL